MIEIEEMKIKDYEEIKDNLQQEFDEFWNSNILKSELENINSKYIVAKENKQIVGFAGIIVTPDRVEITNIVTKKNKRKKGIGTILLDKIIEMAKQTGKDSISLEVNEKNYIAINLYKKFGFEQVGIRKNYYNGTNNAFIMTKKFDV